MYSSLAVSVTTTIDDTLWHLLTFTTTGCDVRATMDGQSLAVSGSDTSLNCLGDTIHALTIDSGMLFLFKAFNKKVSCTF